MNVLDLMLAEDHEQVVFCNDPDVGLTAIIAIHDTTLGPSLGGCRFYNYKTEADALIDVLRLAKGMTYKAAVANLKLGGGKSVIIGDPDRDRRELLFRSFGRFVNSLGGKYLTAEDMNMSETEMEWISRETGYVTGMAKELGGSGDPSPVTAFGVFHGLKAAMRTKFGTEDFSGIKIAIQGVGHVGYKLCAYLHEAGADLTVADVNHEAVNRAVADFGAHAVGVEAIHAVAADIFSPCAMGAILNDRTIPEIKASIVGGGANNQLADAAIHGAMVYARNILYAPDYAINAGGMINVADEMNGYNEERVFRKATGIYDTLMEIFAISERDQAPTNVASDRLAETRIKQAAAQKRSAERPKTGPDRS